MKPASLLLLLILGVCGILPAAAAEIFDARLAADVFAAGLSFIAPRSLEAHALGELAMWGLHGVAALDPALDVAEADGVVRLTLGGRVLAATPSPAPEDVTGWAQLVATTGAAATANSAILRRSGTEALIGGFFDEIFSHFDIYSRYEPPVPAESERDRLSGQAGAGMALTGRLGALRVSDLVPDGPADAAGVRVGDRILTVNGEPPWVLRATALKAALTGDPGTRVDLRVRGLDGVARAITLHLDLVPPQTVFSRRDGDLLVLRISAFASDTAERLSRALDAARVGPNPPAAVAIDLHGNRGGLLRQAVNAVALFADHGMIASTAGRAPDAQHDWRVEGGDITNGMRVMLLVDGSTASAAEVMAAALADLGRGVVIGSATLGKGLVQTITQLPDGGELFVTWSRLLAPLGWPIQGIGVLPQLCTSLGEAATLAQEGDLAAGTDDLARPLAATRAARAPVSPGRTLELRAPCPAATGTDADLAAAHFLAANPKAYNAALLPAP